MFESSLRDPDVDVRTAAARGLAAQNAKESVDALIPSLVDTSDPVRDEVARTLGALGDPRAVAPLIRVRPLMVPEVTAALLQIGDRTAVAPLLAALPSLQPWSQEYVVRALGRIGGPRVLEGLIALLRARSSESPRSGLEAAVVEALGTLGDSSAVAAARERLDRLPPSGSIHSESLFSMLSSSSARPGHSDRSLAS